MAASNPTNRKHIAVGKWQRSYAFYYHDLKTFTFGIPNFSNFTVLENNVKITQSFSEFIVRSPAIRIASK
jgi:hypothetical protein